MIHRAILKSGQTTSQKVSEIMSAVHFEFAANITDDESMPKPVGYVDPVVFLTLRENGPLIIPTIYDERGMQGKPTRLLREWAIYDAPAVLTLREQIEAARARAGQAELDRQNTENDLKRAKRAEQAARERAEAAERGLSDTQRDFRQANERHDRLLMKANRRRLELAREGEKLVDRIAELEEELRVWKKRAEVQLITPEPSPESTVRLSQSPPDEPGTPREGQRTPPGSSALEGHSEDPDQALWALAGLEEIARATCEDEIDHAIISRYAERVRAHLSPTK